MICCVHFARSVEKSLFWADLLYKFSAFSLSPSLDLSCGSIEYILQQCSSKRNTIAGSATQPTTALSNALSYKLSTYPHTHTPQSRGRSLALARRPIYRRVGSLAISRISCWPLLCRSASHAHQSIARCLQYSVVFQLSNQTVLSPRA